MPRPAAPTVARRSPCVTAPSVISRLATADAKRRSPPTLEMRNLYSGAEDWFDRWDRPSCWMDLSADQANSNVMWTRRRPAAGEPRAAWSDTPVDAASEMIATCFRPSMKALRSATLRLWSPESPPRASYLNFPEGPRTTRPDRPVISATPAGPPSASTSASSGLGGVGSSSSTRKIWRLSSTRSWKTSGCARRRIASALAAARARFQESTSARDGGPRAVASNR
mmetsp:Transcript_13036/g.44557  ORF Transcript_13036/g.44557 Transcript_13036/m.44557 type:complete len:225 (-) Transcript_13036:686-1360(-)